MSAPDFTGFPPETFTFLADLAANNQKAWFDEHRAAYQTHVVEPSLAFITAMAAPLARIDPSYQAVPKFNGSYRRINRDVRFSKDKSPYNPRIHLVFWTGLHPSRSPALHLLLDHTGFGFGAGAWAWPPETLEAYRKLVAEDDARRALRDAISKAEALGADMTKPSLKRVPKGWPADHPAADLLKHKGLVVRTHERIEMPETIHTPRFVEDAAEICHGLHPINKWLNDRLN